MSDGTIITREHIRAMARRAFAEGRGRDDHAMNWHAAALMEWRAEWDCCATTRQMIQQRTKEAA